MDLTKTFTLAIDFDGTIVEDAYPKIGKPKIFAFESLKKLQQDGHRLILWTYRYGEALQEAVNFCNANGLEFYAVNCSFPNEVYDPKKSRKINADLFIDDRNVGGFSGWGEIYKFLSESDNPLSLPKKKRFFGLFKS